MQENFSERAVKKKKLDCYENIEKNTENCKGKQTKQNRTTFNQSSCFTFNCRRSLKTMHR